MDGAPRSRWWASASVLWITQLVGGIAGSGAICALAILCWRAGWLGGGDAKLLGACALAVSPHLVASLVVDTSFAGAVLALVYLAARHRVSRPRGPRPADLLARAWRVERWRLARGGPLPYAVAIAGAAIVVLVRGITS
jgi:prepilin peptidase CpaA